MRAGTFGADHHAFAEAGVAHALAEFDGQRLVEVRMPARGAGGVHRARNLRARTHFGEQVRGQLVEEPRRARQGFAAVLAARFGVAQRSEEHTSELQSPVQLVSRLLLATKNASS